MKIYIAGSFDARDTCREIANHIMSLGHMVTSNWLYWAPDYTKLKDENLDEKIKKLDLAAIEVSSGLVIYTDVASSKGGWLFESGVAEGWNMMARFLNPESRKFVHLIGANPRPNAFFTGLTNYPTLENFYEKWPKPPVDEEDKPTESEFTLV